MDGSRHTGMDGSEMDQQGDVVVEIEEHDDGWLVSGPDGVFAVLKDAYGVMTGVCTCGAERCPHEDAVLALHSTPTQSPLHPSTPTPPAARSLAALAIEGQPDLPPWLTGLHPHQWDAVEEVVEHYAAGAKVVFVDAPTGCLSGETMVGINRNGKGLQIKLADLVHRFNGGEITKGKGAKVTWDLTRPTKVQQHREGVVRLATITRAINSGIQQTYTLTTQTSFIRATANHPFWTPEGWVELSSLKVGDRVAVNVGRSNRERKAKPQYRVVNNLRHHPYAGRRGVDPSKGGYSVPLHRLVVEAVENNLTLEQLKDRCKTGEVDGITFLDPKVWEVHHKDMDHLNNDPSNLEKLSPSDHKRHHAAEFQNHVMLQVDWDEIVSVEPYGMEPTFDLTIEGEPEFVANRFVVHNSGKTLIGEATRRVLSRSGHASKALYVCSDRALQDQFLADYDYAKVLKGRANYPTQDGGSQVDCSDCTKNAGESDCMWCHNPGQCPYLVAKMGAIKSPLSVLNTAYLLAEANSAGVFSERAFSILDECDVLEQVLMGYVEFRVGEKVLKKLKLQAPKKGSHYPTIINWIGQELKPKVLQVIGELSGTRTLWGADVSRQREINGLKRLAGSIETILTLGAEGDNWVRDNDAGPLVLKPIKVDLYGNEVLWSHADKWLCMSATIISPDQMADSLGIEDGTWETVSVPMTFPVENRPIYQIPVASMTYKEKETAEPLMAQGVRDVVNMHPGDRVLVHAVSYHLAATITKFLKDNVNRPVVTYTNAGEKEAALRRYREMPGAIMVASSMDRGVDLKDDDCRVVIIAKIPYPSLKDPQVSKRMHMPGGEEWYAVQTVRSIVQMTGRGVRSKEDWAKTYMLDAQFGINVFKRNKMLFPKWWRDAVRFVPYHHLQEGRVI